MNIPQVYIAADDVELYGEQAEQIQFDRWADDIYAAYAVKLAPIDLCDHCKGKSNAYCPTHGIAASNTRQNDFYRKWNERNGE